MPPPAKSDREFCAACGWPLGGMRCEACGAERMDLELRDATELEILPEPALGAAGDKAVEAFRKQEWTRFVGYIVTAEGDASARTVATEDGPGWIATIDGAALFVTLALVGQEVTIEAPVVRLPRHQNVAVLRSALEGLVRVGELSHACLRDDLLLLRARVRLAATSPGMLRRVLREAGRAAREATEMLGAAFLARPAIASNERGHVGFEALGTPRKLAKAIADAAPIAALLGPTKATPIGVRVPPSVLGAAPAPPSSLDEHARSLEARDAADAAPIEDDDELPAILAPMLLTRKKPSAPPPAEPPPTHKSMPPPLPPRGIRQAGAPPPAAGAQGAAKPAIPAARDVVRAFVEDRKNTIKEVPVPRLNGGRLATLELEAVGPDLEPSHRRASPSGEVAILPVDRFCALLKRGQLLAGAVIGDGSSDVTWIVRSAVFRAVYEFREPLADAVAHLYRAAGVSTKVGGALKADAAFAMFETLIDAQANVPKEKPLAVEPLTSAQQAKDHVAKYIGEIERSASDPGLRHYLALGALCELLVRAKLPTQTGQRLRDIISHAQREGAKPAAIDLLMTALKRISA